LLFDGFQINLAARSFRQEGRPGTRTPKLEAATTGNQGAQVVMKNPRAIRKAGSEIVEPEKYIACKIPRLPSHTSF
jgi:hypothetical protein